MRESIYTIPVNEVFEPRDGCPLCRMRDILEERCVEYIMGAAMMESDVRIATNEEGFCSFHFGKMLERRNRLSLALMLESHLAHIGERYLTEDGTAPGKREPSRAQGQVGKCFVCSQIEGAMDRMIANMLHMWEKEPEFRRLFAEQPALCYPHAVRLLELAPGSLHRKSLPEFRQETLRIARGCLEALSENVTAFCRSFDYRSTGTLSESEKQSAERAVWFLTTRKPD